LSPKKRRESLLLEYPDSGVIKRGEGRNANLFRGGGSALVEEKKGGGLLTSRKDFRKAATAGSGIEGKKHGRLGEPRTAVQR